MNIIGVSNSLDRGVKQFVGPDLDPNCLQRLSADNTIRERTLYQTSIEEFKIEPTR